MPSLNQVFSNKDFKEGSYDDQIGMIKNHFAEAKQSASEDDLGRIDLFEKVVLGGYDAANRSKGNLYPDLAKAEAGAYNKAYLTLNRKDALPEEVNDALAGITAARTATFNRTKSDAEEIQKNSERARAEAKELVDAMVGPNGNTGGLYTAMSEGKDKSLSLDAQGRWETPLPVSVEPVKPTPDPNRPKTVLEQYEESRIKPEGIRAATEGLSSKVETAITLAETKLGARSTEYDERIKELQKRTGRSDEDIRRAWVDAKQLNSKWGSEPIRVLTSGQVITNPKAALMMDDEAVTKAINESNAHPLVKDTFIKNLHDYQESISDSVGTDLLYNSMVRPFSSDDFGKAVFKGFEEGKDRTEIVKEYAKNNQMGEIEQSLSAIGETGIVKAAGTVSGALGYVTKSKTMQDVSANISRALNSAAKVDPLLGNDVGFFDKALAEAPSMALMMLATRGIGAGAGAAAEGFGPAAARVAGGFGASKSSQVMMGTFLGASETQAAQIAYMAGMSAGPALSGFQSAGLTYADEFANAIDKGLPREEADRIASKKARIAGLTTAVTTGVFNYAHLGGAEAAAVRGLGPKATVGQLITSLERNGVNPKEATKGFFRKAIENHPGMVALGKGYIGERAEETIDTLASTFLLADPGQPIYNAYEDAWSAGDVGGFAGLVSSVPEARHEAKEGKIRNLNEAERQKRMAAQEAAAREAAETEVLPEIDEDGKPQWRKQPVPFDRRALKNDVGPDEELPSPPEDTRKEGDITEQWDTPDGKTVGLRYSEDGVTPVTRDEENDTWVESGQKTNVGAARRQLYKDGYRPARGMNPEGETVEFGQTARNRATAAVLAKRDDVQARWDARYEGNLKKAFERKAQEDASLRENLRKEIDTEANANKVAQVQRTAMQERELAVLQWFAKRMKKRQDAADNLAREHAARGTSVADQGNVPTGGQGAQITPDLYEEGSKERAAAELLASKGYSTIGGIIDLANDTTLQGLAFRGDESTDHLPTALLRAANLIINHPNSPQPGVLVDEDSEAAPPAAEAPSAPAAPTPTQSPAPTSDVGTPGAPDPTSTPNEEQQNNASETPTEEANSAPAAETPEGQAPVPTAEEAGSQEEVTPTPEPAPEPQPEPEPEQTEEQKAQAADEAIVGDRNYGQIIADGDTAALDAWVRMQDRATAARQKSADNAQARVETKRKLQKEIDSELKKKESEKKKLEKQEADAVKKKDYAGAESLKRQISSVDSEIKELNERSESNDLARAEEWATETKESVESSQAMSDQLKQVSENLKNGLNEYGEPLTPNESNESTEAEVSEGEAETGNQEEAGTPPVESGTPAPESGGVAPTPKPKATPKPKPTAEQKAKAKAEKARQQFIDDADEDALNTGEEAAGLINKRVRAARTKGYITQDQFDETMRLINAAKADAKADNKGKPREDWDDPDFGNAWDNLIGDMIYQQEQDQKAPDEESAPEPPASEATPPPVPTPQAEPPSTPDPGPAPVVQEPAKDEARLAFVGASEKASRTPAMKAAGPVAYANEALKKGYIRQADLDKTKELAASDKDVAWSYLSVALDEQLDDDQAAWKKANGGAPQTTTQQDVSNELEDELTSGEKQEAAVELGYKKWGKAAKDKFTKRFADWLVSGKEASASLTRIFSRIAKTGRNIILSIAVAVSVTPLTVQESQAISLETISNNQNSLLPPLVVEVDRPAAAEQPAATAAEQEAPAPAAEQPAPAPEAAPAPAADVIAPPAAAAPEVTTPAPAKPAPKAEPLRSRADFGKEKPSKDARIMANWVVDKGDNEGLPFSVADKKEGTIYFFDANGKLFEKTPALYGSAIGDTLSERARTQQITTRRASPADKITPAGRFQSRVAPGGESYGDLVRVDNNGAPMAMFAIHKVFLGREATEHRADRLASNSPVDNRVSLGCINVSEDAIGGITEMFSNGGIIYVMPETPAGRGLFSGFAGLTAVEDKVSGPAPAPLPTQEQLLIERKRNVGTDINNKLKTNQIDSMKAAELQVKLDRATNDFDTNKVITELNEAVDTFGDDPPDESKEGFDGNGTYNPPVQDRIPSQTPTAITAKAVQDLVNDLSRRGNIKITWATDMPNDVNGEYNPNTGEVRLNANNIKMTAETPLHEVAHAIIATIRATNAPVYLKLAREMNKMIDKDPALRRIRNAVIDHYGNNIKEDLILDEMMARYLGIHGAAAIGKLIDTANAETKSWAKRAWEAITQFFKREFGGRMNVATLNERTNLGDIVKMMVDPNVMFNVGNPTASADINSRVQAYDYGSGMVIASKALLDSINEGGASVAWVQTKEGPRLQVVTGTDGKQDVKTIIDMGKNLKENVAPSRWESLSTHLEFSQTEALGEDFWLGHEEARRAISPYLTNPTATQLRTIIDNVVNGHASWKLAQSEANKGSMPVTGNENMNLTTAINIINQLQLGKNHAIRTTITQIPDQSIKALTNALRGEVGWLEDLANTNPGSAVTLNPEQIARLGEALQSRINHGHSVMGHAGEDLSHAEVKSVVKTLMNNEQAAAEQALAHYEKNPFEKLGITAKQAANNDYPGNLAGKVASIFRGLSQKGAATLASGQVGQANRRMAEPAVPKTGKVGDGTAAGLYRDLPNSAEFHNYAGKLVSLNDGSVQKGFRTEEDARAFRTRVTAREDLPSRMDLKVVRTNKGGVVSYWVVVPHPLGQAATKSVLKAYNVANADPFVIQRPPTYGEDMDFIDHAGHNFARLVRKMRRGLADFMPEGYWFDQDVDQRELGEKIDPLLQHTELGMVYASGVAGNVELQLNAKFGNPLGIDMKFGSDTYEQVLGLNIPEGKSRFMNDVMEDLMTNPQAYQLTPGQTEYVDTVRALLEQMRQLMREGNLDRKFLNEMGLDSQDFMDDPSKGQGTPRAWFPRFVMGYMDNNGKFQEKVYVGIGSPTTEHKAFNQERMKDDAGRWLSRAEIAASPDTAHLVYSADPASNIASFIRSAMSALVATELRQNLTAEGFVKGEGSVKETSKQKFVKEIPILNDALFENHVAEYLQKKLVDNKKLDSTLQSAEKWAAISKGLVLGSADLAAPLTVAAIGTLTSPLRGIGAVGDTAKNAAASLVDLCRRAQSDPKAFHALCVELAPYMTEMISLGGKFGSSMDYQQTIKTMALASKINNANSNVDSAVLATKAYLAGFGNRLSDFHTNFVHIGKAQMWKAVRSRFEDAEGNLRADPKSVLDMKKEVLAIDRSFGHSVDMDISLKSRNFKGILGIFLTAPGLYVSMINNITTKAGARKMAEFAGVSVLYFMAAAFTAGMPEKEIYRRLIPGAEGFMVVDIDVGGATPIKFGLSHIYKSIFATAGKTYDIADRMMNGEKLGWRDMISPAVSLGESRISPIVSAVTGIITDENYLGERITNGGAILSAFSPASLQEPISVGIDRAFHAVGLDKYINPDVATAQQEYTFGQRESWTQTLSQLAFNTLGANAYTGSLNQKMKFMKDQLSMDRHGVEFKDLADVKAAAVIADKVATEVGAIPKFRNQVGLAELNQDSIDRLLRTMDSDTRYLVKQSGADTLLRPVGGFKTKAGNFVAFYGKNLDKHNENVLKVAQKDIQKAMKQVEQGVHPTKVQKILADAINKASSASSKAAALGGIK